MAEEVQVMDPLWEKGKCGIWHEKCEKVRHDCNFWQELPLSIPTKIGVNKAVTVHICVLFAIFDMVKQPILLTPQGPMAAQAKKFFVKGQN
jgi:hypothetical protein